MYKRQAVERIASVLVLPHPEREAPDVRNMRPNPETEMTAMRVVMELTPVSYTHLDVYKRQSMEFI